jgi:hypothetical protein
MVEINFEFIENCSYFYIFAFNLKSVVEIHGQQKVVSNRGQSPLGFLFFQDRRSLHG